MPEKDPATYALITYGWVILLSILAGLASTIRKIRQGQMTFSLFGVIGEMCISAFVGIVTFFFCESLKLEPVLSAGIIGVCSHMGSRSIVLIEQIVNILVKKWIKNND